MEFLHRQRNKHARSIDCVKARVRFRKREIGDSEKDCSNCGAPDREDDVCRNGPVCVDGSIALDSCLPWETRQASKQYHQSFRCPDNEGDAFCKQAGEFGSSVPESVGTSAASIAEEKEGTH